MQRSRAVLAIVASALGAVALAVGCGLNAVGQLSSGGLSEAGTETGTLDGSSSSSSSGGITDGGVDADAGDDDSGTVFLSDAGGRTTRGLVALYPMRETSGLIVHDVEGATRLDLGRILTATSMRWDPTGLTFFGSGSEVSSPVAAPTKITPACEASNAVSAEAWVTPAAAEQSGPARILSLSNGTSNQSIMLGIGEDGNQFNQKARWIARVHDGLTDRTIFESADNAVTTGLHHVVVTAKQGVGVKLYVDKVELPNMRGSNIDNGFASWIDSNSFRLGGELGTTDRRFIGTISLVAIYCEELTPAEIETNFTAGARP